MATTDIDRLEAGANFTWGVITALWHVGGYDIARYHPWKVRNNCVQTDKVDSTRHLYHGWVDGKDTCFSTEDLEKMLSHLMAVKFDGLNTKADEYFIRAIKTDKGYPRHKS